MRILIIFMVGLLSCSAYADQYDTTTNAQDNTSVASPTSSISNVVTNNNSIARSTIGNVSCSDATIGLSATKTPEFGNYYQVSITAPLSSAFTTTECEKAQKMQNQIMAWDYNDRIYARDQRDRMYEKELRFKEAQVVEKESQIAMLCTGTLHNIMSANPESKIVQFCQDYSNITIADHSIKIPIGNIAEGQVRVSPHKPYYDDSTIMFID